MLEAKAFYGIPPPAEPVVSLLNKNCLPALYTGRQAIQSSDCLTEERILGAGQQASPVSKKFVEIHCGDFSPKKEFTRDKSSHGHLVYLVPVTQYGRNRFYSVPNSMPILKIRCMHLLLLPCALHSRAGK